METDASQIQSFRLQQFHPNHRRYRCSAHARFQLSLRGLTRRCTPLCRDFVFELIAIGSDCSTGGVVRAV